MKRSVVQALIWSDWERHRPVILMTIFVGLAGIAFLQLGGEMPTILGTIFFYTSMIVLGCVLPTSNVLNERKKQILPFLMSLPLSVKQYTTAKLVSTVGIFLVPWLALVVASVTFIVVRPGIPDGIIPVTLTLSVCTLVGFCLIAGVAIVSESEVWNMAATIIINSSYGLGWYMLVRNSVIRNDMVSPVPVWSRQVLTVLGGELALIVVILGLTFYLQSRKRDFV